MSSGIRWRCKNWLKCERMTGHKSGLCDKCRTIKCAKMGCNTYFIQLKGMKLCDAHRGLKYDGSFIPI